MELTIDKRLQELLPAMTDEEREQLAENIVADGRVREPLVYWPHGGKNVIVDGMNRYAIAKRKAIPFEAIPKFFESIEEAELWMLDNALGRRNLLSPQAQRKIRGEMYNRLKGTSGGAGGASRQIGGTVSSGGVSNGGAESAAEHVADKSGVSPRTVERDGKHVTEMAKLTDSLRKQIETGKLKISDEHLKILAKQDFTTQNELSKACRTENKTLSQAMDKAGLVKPTKRAAASPAKTKKGPCQHSEDGQHEWESDGNGVRYCLHCKEDHPEDKAAKKKTPDEPKAVTHLKGIAKTIEHLRVKIDDIVREHGKHGLTDVIMKDLDKALINLKKWAQSVKK